MLESRRITKLRQQTTEVSTPTPPPPPKKKKKMVVFHVLEQIRKHGIPKERTVNGENKTCKLNLITEARIARHDNTPSASCSCHRGHMEPFSPLLVYPLEGERVTYFVRLLSVLGACNFWFITS